MDTPLSVFVMVLNVVGWGSLIIGISTVYHASKMLHRKHRNMFNDHIWLRMDGRGRDVFVLGAVLAILAALYSR